MNNELLDIELRKNTGIGLNGIIFMCRKWTDTLLFHPTNPYDYELLLRALRERNIPHQLDYDRETKTYTFHIWLDKSVNVVIEEPIEYSYEHECPLVATAVGAALLMDFADDEEDDD